MDDLQKIIGRYAGTPFCELPATRQAEYMGALAQRGAADALKAIGLHDAEAASDIKDIRDLLRGLRVLRRAAWTTTFTALGRALGWLAVLTLAAIFMNGKALRVFTGMIGTP